MGVRRSTRREFLATTCGGAAATLIAAPLISAPLAGATGQRSMFGYAIGEVRRYALGPPEALIAGERTEWTITLADISETRGRTFAAFDLGLELRRFGGPEMNENFGRSLSARVIVNEAGFPGRLTLYERMNDRTVVTTYALQENGEYAMTIEWPADTYSFSIPVPSHAELDLGGQRGMNLFFNGQSLRGRARGEFVGNIFSNPGLLSLALPLPVTADQQREMLLFSPTDSMPRSPDASVMRDYQNPAVSRLGNFSRGRLRVGELQEVEIGGRTVEAFELDVRGLFRQAYVDAGGRVLLLEHQNLDARRPRHVRMLWPSEY